MDATRVGGFISLFLGGAMLYKAFSEATGKAKGETDSKMFAIELIVGIPLIYLGFKLLL
jgi:putative Mn2+ efflux pump MntP